ncbi:MAG: thymidine phosphorylase [Thermoanaerobaculia bacterium]|nr:thymidine phosphorylase [Thermoanaerobaculia bacterium]
MSFSPYSLLDRKRQNEPWSPDEIREFLERFMSGEIADYQMTAFLMAVAIHGLTPEEGAALTKAMLESGEEWKLRDEFDFVADKHSTGGVGDKVSLCLTPWVAACGVKIAMLSGRGLGHTGGTLDKLETIPGFRADLSRSEIEECLDRVGCAIATSTTAIAPADRRIYALRDVTGTVRSIPLITASIMSKKLAMGASGLVLDVKTGRGAFMQTIDEARELARSLVSAADASGTRVEALITDMSEPLGRCVGNANEVAEAIDVLRGTGPDDLAAVTRAQAERILVMSGRFDLEEARRALERAIEEGRAIEKAREWIEAQGGNPGIVDDPSSLPQPVQEIAVLSDREGFVSSIDALEIGLIAVDLGAGRRVQEDEIDPAAGIIVIASKGDRVARDEPVASIQLGKRAGDPEVLSSRVRKAFSISDHTPAETPLILDRIESPVV